MDLEQNWSFKINYLYANLVSNVKNFRNCRDFFHRIIETFMLEKTFKVIESNHKPNIAKSQSAMSPSATSTDILNTSREGYIQLRLPKTSLFWCSSL